MEIIEQRRKWNIDSGNVVKVWQKIKDGDKFRLQSFEGLIIAHKHGYEPGATFTVRKISEGIGVERIFPLFSPMIEKIDLVKKVKARKSKLYYVRSRTSKTIRKKMKTLKAKNILNSVGIVKPEGKIKVSEAADKELSDK